MAAIIAAASICDGVAAIYGQVVNGTFSPILLVLTYAAPAKLKTEVYGNRAPSAQGDPCTSCKSC